MADFRLPLSGDVTQFINPWFSQLTGNQFGLLNVYLGQSSEPGLEREIVDKVGTYGRQIGQIGDVLRILMDHLDKMNLDVSKLGKKEQHAIGVLRHQLDKVDDLKQQHQRDPTGRRAYQGSAPADRQGRRRGVLPALGQRQVATGRAR